MWCVAMSIMRSDPHVSFIGQQCGKREQYIEANGRRHDYCSKTCARNAGALLDGVVLSQGQQMLSPVSPVAPVISDHAMEPQTVPPISQYLSLHGIASSSTVQAPRIENPYPAWMMCLVSKSVDGMV